MNKKVLTSTLLGLATATLLFSGCSRPTERPSIEDPKLAGNAYAKADLPEVLGDKASVYIKSAGDQMLKTADDTVEQVDLEGSKAATVLAKVKNKANKAALDAHLGSGSIAIVVLDDQVKILKVVADTKLNANYDVLSRAYLGKLKAFAMKPANKFVAEEKAAALSLKYTAPGDPKLNEKFGMVEVTCLKVEKSGVLENARTDYDEKKSILVLNERPFESATHVLIGGEVNCATGELLVKPTAEELAAAKAAEEATK